MSANNKVSKHGSKEGKRIGSWGTDRLGMMKGTIIIEVPGEGAAELDIKRMDLGNAPPTILPCVNVEWSNPTGAMSVYTYSYEGTGPESFSTGGDENRTTFEMDVTVSQEPIETHPNFENIAATYGWNFQKKSFPRFKPLPAGYAPGSQGPTQSGNPLGGDPNPLFGVESYLVMGATFRKSYVRSFIPAQVMLHIGSISRPPLQIARFKLDVEAARNWLKLAPRISRRGSAVSITEEWMLSGPKGWIPEIYSEQALAGTGSRARRSANASGLRNRR